MACAEHDLDTNFFKIGLNLETNLFRLVGPGALAGAESELPKNDNVAGALARDYNMRASGFP